jgi:heterodisulfide reductase subunit A
MANIREHCSWVVDDPTLATDKAKHMVSAAVSRVHHHRPLDMRSVEMQQSALVLGGGYMVEREPSIGGHMAQLYKTFPTLDCAA